MTTYYDNLQAEDRTPLKQKIRDFFALWHRGKDKAVNLTDAVPVVMGNDSSSNRRRFRMAVDELVDEGMLIGSNSSDGYWYCGSWNEVDEAAGELQSRIEKLSSRRKKLMDNAAREFGGQKGLFG